MFLPVSNAVAVRVRSAEADEPEVVDGEERVHLPVVPDEAELVSAGWDLGKEEVGVLARPVGRGDDLPRYEESVDEEREVERIRLSVEVVLSNAHCERVRSAFGDREVPGKRARALGCVCDAFSIRAPRSRRGGERRTRNRRPGGNRRPVDVRDERIAARVAQLGIVRRPVAIRIGDDRICPSAEFLDVDESVAVRIFEAVGKERNRAVCSFPRVGHAVAIRVG